MPVAVAPVANSRTTKYFVLQQLNGDLSIVYHISDISVNVNGEWISADMSGMIAGNNLGTVVSPEYVYDINGFHIKSTGDSSLVEFKNEGPDFPWPGTHLRITYGIDRDISMFGPVEPDPELPQ